MGGLSGPGPIGGLPGPGPMGGLSGPGPIGFLPLISWVSIRSSTERIVDSPLPCAGSGVTSFASCLSIYCIPWFFLTDSTSIWKHSSGIISSWSASGLSTEESISRRFMSLCSSSISKELLSVSAMFHMLVTRSAPSDDMTVSQIVSHSLLTIRWSGYSSYIGLFL